MKDLFVNSTFIILLVTISCFVNIQNSNSSRLSINSNSKINNLTEKSLETTNLNYNTTNLNLSVNYSQLISIKTSESQALNNEETTYQLNSTNSQMQLLENNITTLYPLSPSNIKDSYYHAKIEEISKNLQAFDTYKAKVEILKSKIEKKVASSEVDKFNLANNIIGSNKVNIMFLCVVALCLMLGLVLKVSFFKSNKNQSNKFLNESKTNSTYSVPEKKNLNDCMINLVDMSNSKRNDESLKIELKGRTLKVPSVEALCYNLNYKPVENKNLFPISNPTTNSNKYFNMESFKPLEKFSSLNLENKMISTLKSNIPCYQNKPTESQLGAIRENDRSQMYTSFLKMNNNENIKNAYEFSFGLDTSQNNFGLGFTGKFNLNDTVDYEEREEYANIINSLGI